MVVEISQGQLMGLLIPIYMFIAVLIGRFIYRKARGPHPLVDDPIPSILGIASMVIWPIIIPFMLLHLIISYNNKG